VFAGGLRVLVVEHEPGAPIGLLGPWLGQAGATCEVVRPWRGDPVPRTVAEVRSGGAHGLIVLGGEQHAMADDAWPWLPATRSLLAAASEEGLPTLGVCLGGQLLAVAAGGSVARREPAEVGVSEVEILPTAGDDPLFGRVWTSGARRVPAIQFHGDQVTQVPPAALVLATNAAAPVQAFRVGQAAWGVQFHPEVDAAVLAGWVDGEAELLVRAGVERTSVISVAQARAAELASIWRPWAQAFVSVIRDR